MEPVYSFGFRIYGFGLNTVNVCINESTAHRWYALAESRWLIAPRCRWMVRSETRKVKREIVCIPSDLGFTASGLTQ
jgi:hypothetical protein